MVIKALLVAIVYWGFILIHRFGANSMAERPIVIGSAIGIILGNPVLGALIGAQLEVIYLGIVSVGGAQATDPMYATAMAVALSVMTGIPREAAIALAIPLGFIGLFILQVTRLFFAFVCPVLDKFAEADNRKAYCATFIGHILVGYSFAPITIFIALTAGAEATQTFIDSLPPFIMKGMQTAGGMLPALGLGILLSMIWDNKKAIYFFLGFVMVVYLKIPMIGLAIIGVFLMLTDLYNNQKIQALKQKKVLVSNSDLKDEEVFFNE